MFPLPWLPTAVHWRNIKESGNTPNRTPQSAIKRHDPKSLPASHADDYEHSFNWSQTEILGQAATRHVREFKEAYHSMDRSTFDIPTIYHRLKQTQNPQLIIFDDWNSPYKQQLDNPLLELFPTPTNINAQSTNDNNPVNHQPIRHSTRLESQRRMSELDIKTPDTS